MHDRPAVPAGAPAGVACLEVACPCPLLSFSRALRLYQCCIQGLGLASPGSSPLFEALASREASPESALASQSSSPASQTRPGLAQQSAAGSGATSQLGRSTSHPFAEDIARKDWQLGGQPSAPRASPRTESTFTELHSARQRRQGEANALADSAASMVLPRAMGSSGQRPGTHADRIAEEEAVLPHAPAAGGSSVRTPLGSGGGNPFRDALQAQRAPSGNPFADLPAEAPAQAPDTPYSQPSEEAGPSAQAQEQASSSVHWRTNLAASWDASGRQRHGSRASMQAWREEQDMLQLAPLRNGPLAQQRVPWDCMHDVRGGAEQWPVCPVKAAT
jgi:hypothetical protein